MTGEARTLLVEAMRRHGLGGAAVAIVSRDAPAQFECAGLADAADNRQVDPETVFRIASISKTMTAVGLMQLRDRGLFDLDDPINKYLASIRVDAPPGAAEVTFRHLLTHTAGIGELPRVTDLVRREAWGTGKPGVGPADLAALYGGTLHTDVAPGAKWAYANHGFAVVAQLVEDISGEPFAAHMRRHLFDPLGMDHTEYQRTARTADRVATGYRWQFGRSRRVPDYDLSIFGPGSVLSSVLDMAAYAAWLIGHSDGADVLRRDTLAEMMSPQYAVHPRFAGMGLAFFVDRLGGHRLAGHDGNVPGFASALLTAPDDGIAAVALTNTSSFIGAHLLGRSVLRDLLGVPDETEALHANTVADPPQRWSELVGYYAPSPGFLTNTRSWQMVGGEVQVAVKDRQLVVRALSPVRQLRQGLVLHRLDPDDLVYAASVEGLVIDVAFSRDAAGNVDRVIFGPPANVVFHRRSPMRSSRVRRRGAAAGASALLLAAALRRRRR